MNNINQKTANDTNKVKTEITRVNWFKANDTSKEYSAVDISLRTADFSTFADIHCDDEKNLILIADIINDFITKNAIKR